MQIEEGFSLRQNRSITLGRLSVALMVGAIGMLLLWIIGIIAKIQKIHYHFQANTTRDQNVLSLFIVGWQVLEEGKVLFPQMR